jgi:N-acetylglucosamine-6-phosphate deacetylase
MIYHTRVELQKKGAHPEENLRGFPNGISDLLHLYGNLDQIAIVTIAPELEKSREVIQELVRRGITLALYDSLFHFK